MTFTSAEVDFGKMASAPTGLIKIRKAVPVMAIEIQQILA